MVGWDKFVGKQVYITSRNSKHPFTGKVVDVDDADKNIIFITIIDKFKKRVTLVASEITMIKEEN